MRAILDGRAFNHECESPEPEVPPVTTIGWRMVHVGRDVLGRRARALFGPTDAPPDADMFDPGHWPETPITAAGGLAMLEEGYRSWRDGVAALDDESLMRPVGPLGGLLGEFPMAALVAHLSRETVAHGGGLSPARPLSGSGLAIRVGPAA
ncbi:DinB family protein [Promicromonospora soli]